MKIGRAAYTVVGAALVGIGFVGMFLPGLPTTVFMIMALFCFKKGSSRLENWLLDHPVFGKTLRDWERDKSISLRTKRIATAMIFVFATASVIVISSLWVKALVAGLALFGIWYVASRKTTVSQFAAVETLDTAAEKVA